MSNLYTKVNYRSPVLYYIANNIYEYDIQKANINVLYSINEISKDQYIRLLQIPKIERQIEIGLMMRKDPELYKKLSNGITHYRKLLFESNQIKDTEVLSIKNDAIFIIGRKLYNTSFNNIKFILKNEYTTYMYLGKLEIYFRTDIINNNYIIDIKGINDDNLYLHEAIISKLCEILYLIESGDIEYAIKVFNEFYNAYINRSLSIEYYRPLSSDGKYIIKSMNMIYCFDQLSDNDINSVDIEYNQFILRSLYRYLCEIYFSRAKNRRG